MTLTFKLVAWFLQATNRFIMMIICAKYFRNPTLKNKVMDRTGICVTIAYAIRKRIRDSFKRDTSSDHDDCLCQNI